VRLRSPGSEGGEENQKHGSRDAKKNVKKPSERSSESREGNREKHYKQGSGTGLAVRCGMQKELVRTTNAIGT